VKKGKKEKDINKVKKIVEKVILESLLFFNFFEKIWIRK
jgi:hypothetical protein